VETFSEPKDNMIDFPITIESSSTMAFDSMAAPPLYHELSSCFGFRPQHVPSEVLSGKRSFDDIIEPVPIGPRTNLNVVEEISVQDTISSSFDQCCEDLLIETFLPTPVLTNCCLDNNKISEDLLIEIGSELRNKRRKLAIVTPRSSFYSIARSSFDEPSELQERKPDLLLSGGGQEAAEQQETCSSSDLDDIHPAVLDHRWSNKYKKLCAFHKKYGHCLVQCKTPDGINCQPLSQWVKRQRHQRKRKRLRRHFTLTEDREMALNKLGFVWDSHEAAWNQKFGELLAFKAAFDHCNVPIEYPENPQLSIWVKCQRRQYKLYLTGKKSTISTTRMDKLTEVGFVWNPRNLKL
jgi:hypothetical protein